jgi:hypothetical protein
MKKLITGTRGLLAAITIVGLVFGLAGYSEAGYKTVIDGISVSYSKDGANAYYDEEDGTLTVAIGEDGGALKISVGPDAPSGWGDYVDIYILADDASLKSIQIKGTDTCTPYIVGQVGYVSSFKLLNGVVGGTDYYPDLGLGRVSVYMPSKITFQNSVAVAQVLGYAYVPAASTTTNAEVR